MATIKLANTIVAMAGKIAGTVYSRNKGGAYARTWVKPTNPKSSAQLAVRAILTALSQAWRGLTAAQRAQWDAATANFKTKNRLGDSITLTGNGLYVQLNKNLSDINQSLISVPPVPTAVGYLSAMTLAAAEGAGTIAVTFTAVDDTDTAYKVFATPALSPGKSSAGTEYRQIGYSGAAEASPFNIKTMYDAKFGAVGAAGQKIFVKLVPVDVNTGIAGQAREAVAVIGA